jgi:hypothetical protein
MLPLRPGCPPCSRKAPTWTGRVDDAWELLADPYGPYRHLLPHLPEPLLSLSPPQQPTGPGGGAAARQQVLGGAPVATTAATAAQSGVPGSPTCLHAHQPSSPSNRSTLFFAAAACLPVQPPCCTTQTSAGLPGGSDSTSMVATASEAAAAGQPAIDFGVDFDREVEPHLGRLIGVGGFGKVRLLAGRSLNWRMLGGTARQDIGRACAWLDVGPAWGGHSAT